jgi:hypothetical protein
MSYSGIIKSVTFGVTSHKENYRNGRSCRINFAPSSPSPPHRPPPSPTRAHLLALLGEVRRVVTALAAAVRAAVKLLGVALAIHLQTDRQSM